MYSSFVCAEHSASDEGASHARSSTKLYATAMDSNKRSFADAEATVLIDCPPIAVISTVETVSPEFNDAAITSARVLESV